MSDKTYFQYYYQNNREKKIAQAAEWQRENSEHRRGYMREYAKQNPDKFKRTDEQQAEYNKKRRERYAKDAEFRNSIKQKTKDWQSNNPEKRFAQRLKKYGITPECYHRMFDEQSGACAICKTTDPGDKASGRFFVDHCHTTGNVRGLLCNNCNFGIGQFRDNTSTLLAAIRYIEQASERQGSD